MAQPRTVEEALAAAEQPVPKFATVEEALNAAPSTVPEEISSGIDASQYYKPGTSPTEIGQQEKLLHQSYLGGGQPEPSWLRFSKWTLREMGKTAPYLLAAEGGASLVPKGAPIVQKILASSAAQGLLAGIKEKSPLAGLETAGAAFLGEAIPTRFGMKSAIKRGVPSSAVAGTAERGTLGRAAEMFGKVTPAQEAAPAYEAAAATKQALRTKSQGRVNAEAAMAFRDTLNAGLGNPPAIDTAPLKQALTSQIHAGATLPERQALNEWLQERADSLPPRMTHGELDDFIREWGETIKSTYGKARSDITVPQGARRTVADTGRALRDRMMPEAAADFQSAERYIDSTKTLRKMLVDAKGKVRPGAPGIWRQALENDIIMQRLQAFDDATGNNVTERGLSLARKKIWTGSNAQEAVGILRLTSTPSPVISVRTPSSLSKLAIVGSRPAGAVTSRMMLERYKQQQEKSPEEMFPGMTNAPAQESK